MTERRKSLLLLGLAVVWSASWGLRAAVELYRDNWGWALYSALMLVAGAGWCASRLRRFKEASGARAADE